MDSFILSEKEIPNLSVFDSLIRETIPEFDGLVVNGDGVSILLNTSATQQLIDAIEAIIPPTVPEFVSSYNTNQTNAVTTSSSTPVVVSGMSVTPNPGKYIVIFSGSIYTGGASAEGQFGIYKNGVLINETRREIKCNLQLLGGLVTVSLNAIGVGTYTGAEIELDGDDTVDIRFKSNNGGTIGFVERTMTLMRLL